MRRILRKIAAGDFEDLGDTSTLGRARRGRRPREQSCLNDYARVRR